MGEQAPGPEEPVRFNKRYYEQTIAIPAELANLSPAAREHVKNLETERDLYKKEARTDPLTELANRKAWHEWIDPKIDSLQRRRQGGELRRDTVDSLFVAVIDIDKFKLVNDLAGHGAGDEVLKWLAAEIRGQIRVSDVVARIGGEEFAVGLSGVDKETAFNRIEDLRHQIEAASPEKLAEWGITDRKAVTISAGLAEYDQGCADYNDVFLRSDAALYIAKQDRNKVVEYSPSDAEMTAKVREA